jgi:hypothetical protein
MPEWLVAVLTFGSGIVGGVLIAFASTVFNAWYQDRRERKKRGVRLLARLHLLFEQAKPEPMLFLATLDQERAQRAGADLWRRWREFRESFLEFQFDAPEPVEKLARETATHVAISIQATRNAINEADDRETAQVLKKNAEDAYSVASECIDDLDHAFAGRALGRSPDAVRRRSPQT